MTHEHLLRDNKYFHFIWSDVVAAVRHFVTRQLVRKFCSKILRTIFNLSGHCPVPKCRQGTTGACTHRFFSSGKKHKLGMLFDESATASFLIYFRSIEHAM